MAQRLARRFGSMAANTVRRTQITVLDGGLGQELVKRYGQPPTPLWSTQVMLEQPGLVGELHADFYTAGAHIATTNSYTMHRDRLRGTPYEHQLKDLCKAAVEEASRVRPIGKQIAASIGPLGGSYRIIEYDSLAEAAALYEEKATNLEGVDLYIIETVASLDHARAALEGVTRVATKPVWLAVTVDDSDGTLLRSGEAVADVCAIALEFNVAAILANCSAPEAIPAALEIFEGTGLPYGAYANGFTHIDEAFLVPNATVTALKARTDLNPIVYSKHALSWVAQGATILGGCCETGPEHIAAMVAALTEAGYDIHETPNDIQSA